MDKRTSKNVKSNPQHPANGKKRYTPPELVKRQRLLHIAEGTPPQVS